MYHMVTGNVPFDGKNPSAVMHKHLKAELVPPDHVNPKLSAGVSEVIEMMMAKSPKARYQNCRDLLIDLRAVRKGEQAGDWRIATSGPSISSRSSRQKPSRRVKSRLTRASSVAAAGRCSRNPCSSQWL
jgi:serine/threonine protein kinase